MGKGVVVSWAPWREGGRGGSSTKLIIVYVQFVAMMMN